MRASSSESLPWLLPWGLVVTAECGVRFSYCHEWGAGVSLNDLVTAILALAAVLVPFAALIISGAVDKRAARTTLADLAVKINKKSAAYDKLIAETASAKAAEEYARTKGGNDLYVRVKELEMLADKAGFLIDRLKPGMVTRWVTPLGRRPRYPWSVTITLAQALESAEDPWWADRYWKLSVETRDPHVRAWAYAYWAMALCNRLEYRSAHDKVAEGLKGFTSQEPDECIFRGDIYAAVIPFHPDNGEWAADALREYGNVLSTEELYSTAEDRIERVKAMMASIGQSNTEDVTAKSTA
jgi:hypothetical protein